MPSSYPKEALNGTRAYGVGMGIWEPGTARLLNSCICAAQKKVLFQRRKKAGKINFLIDDSQFFTDIVPVGFNTSVGNIKHLGNFL